MPVSSPHLSVSSAKTAENPEHFSLNHKGSGVITQTASILQSELYQKVLREDFLRLIQTLKTPGSPRLASVSATAPQGHAEPSILLPLLEQARTQKTTLLQLQRKDPKKFAQSTENGIDITRLGIRLNVAQAQLGQHKKSQGALEANIENIIQFSAWMQNYLLQHEKTCQTFQELLKTGMDLPPCPKKLDFLNQWMGAALQILLDKTQFIEDFYPLDKSYFPQVKFLISQFEEKRVQLILSKENTGTGFSQLRNQLVDLANKLNPLTEEQKCLAAIGLSCTRSMALLDRSKSRDFFPSSMLPLPKKIDQGDLSAAFEQLNQAFVLSQIVGKKFKDYRAIDATAQQTSKQSSAAIVSEKIEELKKHIEEKQNFNSTLQYFEKEKTNPKSAFNYFEEARSKDHLQESILERDNSYGVSLIDKRLRNLFDYTRTLMGASRSCIMHWIGITGDQMKSEDASRENLLSLAERFDRAVQGYDYAKQDIETLVTFINPDNFNEPLNQAIQEATQEVMARHSLTTLFSEVVKRFALFHAPSLPDSRLPGKEWKSKNLQDKAHRVAIADKAFAPKQQTKTDFQNLDKLNEWLDSLSVEDNSTPPVPSENSKKKNEKSSLADKKKQTETVFKARTNALQRINPMVLSSTKTLKLITQERDYFNRSMLAENALENASAAADIFFQLIQVCDENPHFDKKQIDHPALQNGFLSCMKMASLFDAYLAAEKDHRPSLDMLESAQIGENTQNELKLSIADDNRFITSIRSKSLPTNNNSGTIHEHLIEFRADRPPVKGSGFGGKEYEIPHFPVWIHLHVSGKTDVSVQGLRNLVNGQGNEIQAVTLKDELNRTRGATFTRRYGQPVDRVVLKENKMGLEALKTLLSHYTDEQLAHRLAQDEQIEFVKPDSLAPQPKWTVVER